MNNVSSILNKIKLAQQNSALKDEVKKLHHQVFETKKRIIVLEQKVRSNQILLKD